ncbi:MAG: hypothetical protein ACK6CT_08475 [Planctomycetia bacterium]
MERANRIVVGILSCQKNVGKKRAVQATWLRDLRAAGVPAYFLVGRPGRPAEVEGDVLYLDCADTYVALCDKTLAFLRFARERLDCDYIFKCDDDTYVDVVRWDQVPYAEHDFTAGRLLPYSGGYRVWMQWKGLEWKPEYDAFLSMVAEFPCGGEGYFLSRRAINLILESTLPEALKNPPGSEDILVTGLLKLAGINLFLVPELAGQTFEVLRNWTVAKKSRFVTVHPVGPMQMRLIHWRHRAWVDIVYGITQVVKYVRRQITLMLSRSPAAGDAAG